MEKFSLIDMILGKIIIPVQLLHDYFALIWCKPIVGWNIFNDVYEYWQWEGCPWYTKNIDLLRVLCSNNLDISHSIEFH